MPRVPHPAEYEYIAQIGEGSFSQVLKVRDRQLDCHFAAKRMLKTFKSMAEANEVNEIQAIRSMEGHPNVIGLVDIVLYGFHLSGFFLFSYI